MKHNLDSQDPRVYIHTRSRNNGNSVLRAPLLIRSATPPHHYHNQNTPSPPKTLSPTRHALVDRLIRRPFVRQRICIVVRRVLSCNNVSFSPYRPRLPLLFRHPLSSPPLSTTFPPHSRPFVFTPLHPYRILLFLLLCCLHRTHIS